MKEGFNRILCVLVLSCLLLVTIPFSVFGEVESILCPDGQLVVGDAAVGALAIAWNFGANIINTGMNVLGYGMEAADTGYSAVLGGGLTGGGLSGDLTALSMACQALGIEGQLASRTLNILINQLQYVSCVDDVGSAVGNHTVYGLKDPITGEIKYIGRTTNPGTRELQHLASPDKGGLKFFEIQKGLTYEQARGLEQLYFKHFGGFDKLLNKINPISSTNPKLPIYQQAAEGVK